MKPSTILILAGILIFGCKETTDQSSPEAVLTSTKQPLTLAALEEQASMTWFTTVRNTDYLSVGTGGLEDDGIGEIRVIGTFPLSSVTKVYLYWHSTSEEYEEVAKNIKFNTSTIAGTIIGYPRGTQAFRADVTAIVKSSSSRIFKVSTFEKWIADGASLVLFYSDGNSNNNRDIVLFNGNDSNGRTKQQSLIPNSPVDLKGWDVLLSGVKYTSGIVNVTMHVAGGDLYMEGPLYLNGSRIGGILQFEGRSVPGGTPNKSARWDIEPTEVSRLLSPGINSMHLTMPDFDDDLLTLVVVVFNLPKGAAPK